MSPSNNVLMGAEEVLPPDHVKRAAHKKDQQAPAAASVDLLSSTRICSFIRSFKDVRTQPRKPVPSWLPTKSSADARRIPKLSSRHRPPTPLPSSAPRIWTWTWLWPRTRTWSWTGTRTWTWTMPWTGTRTWTWTMPWTGPWTGPWTRARTRTWTRTVPWRRPWTWTQAQAQAWSQACKVP